MLALVAKWPKSQSMTITQKFAQNGPLNAHRPLKYLKLPLSGHGSQCLGFGVTT